MPCNGCPFPRSPLSAHETLVTFTAVSCFGGRGKEGATWYKIRTCALRTLSLTLKDLKLYRAVGPPVIG